LILAAISLAAPAEAHPVTYVSGKGSDANDCFSPATPCRTFQRAVNQNPGIGEVKALDPADYGPVTITKPITITGVPGAGIDTNGGTAVSIDTIGLGVRLDHLIIQNGIGAIGSTGIAPRVLGSFLIITNCTVNGYETGIAANSGNYLIADTAVTNNRTGISAFNTPM
jgi:hypothetical protein